MTREEAVNIMKNYPEWHHFHENEEKAFRMGLKSLEQKSKTGHWEKTTDEYCYCYWYRCSCCGTKTPKNEWGSNYFSSYCPECGAKMEAEDR